MSGRSAAARNAVASSEKRATSAPFKKNGDRPHLFCHTSLGWKNKWGLSPFFKLASPFHLAVLRVRILVLLEGLLKDAHLHAVRPRALHRLQNVEVLDRMLIHVVGELAADRVEVGLRHRLHNTLP